MNDRHTFKTDATPEDEQFETTVEKAVKQYRDRLYDGHWYGLETDGMLRQAVRASLADSGTVLLRELYEHFAEPPVEIESIDEELRELIDNCATKLLYRLDGLTDEQADYLDLTEQEANYIDAATAGETGAGYSQVLLMVEGEGKYPLRVEALPEEVPLIDPDAAVTVGGGY